MKILLITIFILSLSFAAHSQTVTISQEAADKCVENTQKLDGAQKVIDQFLKERAASDLALAKAGSVIEIDKLLLAAKDELGKIQDAKVAQYQELIKIYDQMLKVQSDMIDRLTAKMLKPKSALTKFLDSVKEVIKAVGYIAAGAAISRL